MMQISLFKLTTDPALNENQIISLEISISYEFFPFRKSKWDYTER